MASALQRLLTLYFLIFSVCHLSRSDPASESRPSLTSRTVRTKYGDVSGVIITLESKHLEPVEVFRGIPYASPPLGSLRFMPPVTGALWQGVKIADKFSPVCPQRLPDIANETAALRRIPRGRLEYLRRLLPHLKEQSEDCLYLNIYAPAQGENTVNPIGKPQYVHSKRFPSKDSSSMITQLSINGMYVREFDFKILG
ncbi:hypothetical protein JTB14_037922 [Gonioctena quinquepunctata]|nr:hypothetical protein JTB14_037922 [Gonioctena quinquepunctata]